MYAQQLLKFLLFVVILDLVFVHIYNFHFLYIIIEIDEPVAFQMIFD